jgi:hypothetical protein
MNSEFVICKACGFIMKKDNLHDVCPACGVPAKMFEPYIEKLSPRRKFILMLDIHPIMAHFPIAFMFTLFGLFAVSFFASAKLLPAITSTIDVIAVLLPISIVITFLTGLFDAKIRFRKVTTPILKMKIVIGILFIITTTAITAVHFAAPATGLFFGIKFALSAVSIGFASYLGTVGASLLNAKLPG